MRKAVLLFLVGFLSSPVWSGTVSSLSTEWAEGVFQVRVYAPGVSDYRVTFLKNQTPRMLVVDLLDATYRLPKRRYPVREAGGVLAIRGSQFQVRPRRIARIVVDLTDSLPYTVNRKGDTLVLALRTARGAARSIETFTTFTAKSLRDPFTPWFEEETGGDTLFNPLRGELVGIIESDNGQRYALLQEPNKPGFILKKGDPVLNGVVLAVTSRSVVFYVRDKGIPRRIVLELKGGKKKGRSS